MDSLDVAIKSLVKACTQADKAQCLKKVSRKFYTVCRQAGMRREDILALATEIIDCFTEDIKSLRGKVEGE
jgi:hypothetical protein